MLYANGIETGKPEFFQGEAVKAGKDVIFTERSKPMNLLTLPALLSAVDTALYDAKSADRNCVRVYQSPQAA